MKVKLDSRRAFIRKEPRNHFPRDIRLLAIARLISEIGDEMVLIALIFALKDSGPGAVSLLLATFAASRILVAPLAGSIVDRFPTRRLIVTISVTQFLSATALVFVADPFLYLFVFLLSVGGSTIGPAWQSFIAHVVPPDDLSKTYAFIQSYRSLAIVAGAGFGGFIVDRFGSDIAILANASTFLVVAIIGGTLVRQRVPSGRVDGIKGLGGGFLAFARSAVLRWTLVMLTAFNMSAGVGEVLSAFLITNELGGNATDYGIVLGSLGASMFLAGAFLSRIRLPFKEPTMLTVSAILSACGMAAYALSPNVQSAVACFALNGIGLTGLHVFGTPIFVRHSIEQERGRLFAASSSVTTAGVLIATGIAGVIGEAFPPRPVIFGSAMCCLLVAVVGGVQIRRNGGELSVAMS